MPASLPTGWLGDFYIEANRLHDCVLRLMAAPLRITLITVARNAARTIADTVRSVAAQDYPQVEYIVIDGASTDGTAEVVQRNLGTNSYLISELDQGVYDAMNKGITIATGDVIGFLNADDVFAHKHVLSRITKVFRDPVIEACYADLIYVDQYNPHKIVRYWKSGPYVDGLFEKGWMPAHPTFYVRRAVYEKFGGFDLTYKRQSDFELTMRFLKIHGLRAMYIPEVWVHMRVGGLSNNSLIGLFRGNLEAYQACRKHGLAVGPLFIPKKILSRIPQYFRRPRDSVSNT